MDSLIGERFLKQFFGSRSNRRKVNQEGIPTKNEANKLTEPGNLLGEDPLEKEATLENKKTAEANILGGPEDGSVQPVNDQ